MPATRPITFGAFVPQGWKTELVAVDGAEAQWAKAVEIAELAEALGYDSIWVYDHFHNVPRPAHEAVFECWTTLAALSQRTSRVRLGQMVGTPEQVSEKVQQYVELGCTSFLPWHRDYPATETLTRFAQEVAPNFR